ncbi:MAG: DUF47 family protein [Magnetococcales bacterium]|nr:DUF47 family protein [Magnetococcales bacterium]
MGMPSLNLFGKTKEIELQFDEFLNTISEGGLLLKSGWQAYLDRGAASSEFKQKLQQVVDHEKKGDSLRRTLETELYTMALIPDFRGDVLSLLEDLDQLLNGMEENILALDTEAPVIPAELKADIQQLMEHVASAVEYGVISARAFLRDINSVRDNLHKVMLFEKEADQAATKLKKNIFQSSMQLAEKNQLRYFVEKIDNLADVAEDVADMLGIYTIKRLD